MPPWLAEASDKPAQEPADLLDRIVELSLHFDREIPEVTAEEQEILQLSR